jgi:hypothetical protein
LSENLFNMYDWENVTHFFSEEDRHYKNTYLEISEVYDEKIEVSLFSQKRVYMKYIFRMVYFMGLFMWMRKRLI